MLSARGLLHSGAVLSAIGHLSIVAAVVGLLAYPRMFASRPTEAVMVDIIPPAEMPGGNKTANANATDTKAPENKAPDNKAPSADKAAGQPQAEKQPPADEASPPLSQGMATFTPMPQPKTPPSMFSAPKIPELLDLVTPATSTGLAPPAEMPADLTADDVATFKARLRTCWTPPADVAGTPALKVTLRVFLSPNGALARQPVLLAASASTSGPALVKTALAALTRCQPFKLPADRYKEWKVLDLTLSPGDMAGG